ncbi:hypothetical protein AH04_114 [Erwinia phage AH04]|uniref:Uncharacterized protein n=1 Tax=Erwinia phage AH04 TaxID=2869569 RepID=A0AAE7X0J8_9CAUD|nr:hypothetical protein PQC02_gp200 [Erwinia phage AH04]QZA70595.1 hypothetical protein AH04_114 [Erwinia phage AH04]
MNVDAVNLTLTQLKSLGLSAFNKLNGVVTSLPPSSLIFTKASADDKVLLQDVQSKAGVLMNKISLGSIFPDGIDIRPYKKAIVQEQNQVNELTAAALNTKYATTLTVNDPDVLDTATGFDPASVRDFLTFCRVFGFYELTLNSVHLSTIDGKLIISVNSTHDYFTGFVEVLV